MNNVDIKQPTVAFATVGCRLNQAETDKLAESFLNRGWRIVKFIDMADLYFINTCTVTGRADRSSRQLIHRARRNNPSALLIAAGCFAAREGEELAKEGEVDVILGTNEKNHPFDFIPKEKPSQPLIYIGEIKETTETAMGIEISGRSRAILKVQDGCDHQCAYCVVTMVRGISRSAPLGEIKSALKKIKSAGFNEVVLTGVNLSSWGRDITADNLSFTDLVCLGAEIGINRVRISSVEPWEITPKVVETLSDIPQWCEHLHISLQTGDPELLSAMGRGFDLAILKSALLELRSRRTNATIGADIITGLPGESKASFEKTVEFIEGIPVDYLHVFPFSARPLTEAAKMENKVSTKIKDERASILRDVSKNNKLNHMRRMIGQELEVLIEENGNSGYLRNYLKFQKEGMALAPKSLHNVFITGISESEKHLIGEIKSERIQTR